MSTILNVRKGEEHDLQGLARLFDDYRIFYRQEPNLPAATRFVQTRLQAQDSIFFVAEAEGKLRGFTQLYPSWTSVGMARIWILNDLFVAESVRKQGCAELLMQQAVHFARSTGAKRLVLQTAKDNFPAQALYEKLGWKRSDGFFEYQRELSE